MDTPRQSLAERVADALLDLGNASSQKEMQAQIESLCKSYPATTLLGAMLKVLPEADSQIKGGLGLLAQQLPRQATEEKLLQQVLNSKLSAQVRFSAVTILQDYLERPVDPGFVSDISNVDSVVLASMQDAFKARKKHPGVLIEYTEQFSQLEAQHRQYVLSLLQHVKIEDAADLLQTMAFCPDREVCLEALEALAALKNEAGEKALYVLGQSLYLDTELAGKARQLLRKSRLAGNQFTPSILPGNSLARFLGIDNGGVAHWYLAHEDRPYGLLVGYGFRQGVRSLQKIPPASMLAGWEESREDSHDSRFDWARWHLSFTLSHFPPTEAGQEYPEMYQLLASELWRWEPPAEGSEILAVMRQSSFLDPCQFNRDFMALNFSQLPYAGVLRSLCFKDSLATQTDRISLCVWFLTACALALWPKQQELASLYAGTAKLLEEDPRMGSEFLAALQEHWTAKPE